MGDLTAPPPPPDSWASRPDSDVGVFYVTLPPASSFTLPAAKFGAAINRTAYVVEGPRGADANGVRVGGTAVPKGRASFVLRADVPCVLENGAGSAEPVHILVLQGRPIGQPVAQSGPFVMNTQAEIAKAYSDYRATQFGGWPWAEDAVVFDRAQGRFADIVGIDGKKTREYPPMTGDQLMDKDGGALDLRRRS